MQKLLLGIASLFSACVLASPMALQKNSQAPAASAGASLQTSYSLNAVSSRTTGPWSFFASAVGETSIYKYLRVTPGIDAANVVRVVAETAEPYRPVMEWEYGYSAGLITIRPESDRNVASKKGDLIAMWAAPARGRYQVQINVDNVGNDARGGDGGTIILSKLRRSERNDTRIIERVVIPASGFQSPHVQRSIVVEVDKGDRIVLRLNAGIDGFADLWRMRYVISRAKINKQAVTSR